MKQNMVIRKEKYKRNLGSGNTNYDHLHDLHPNQ